MKPLLELLLLLYPRTFRARYGTDMLRALEDRREAASRSGWWQRFRLLAETIGDLVAGAIGERLGRPGPGPRIAVRSGGGSIVESLAQDLRLALRLLVRRPALSAVSALTLGLGIGAAAAMASLIDAILLQPLPFAEPSRIVGVRGSIDDRQTGVSYENLRDLKTQSQTLAAVSPFFAQSVNLTGVPEPDRLRGGFVTSDFFNTIGVAPVMGAAFSPDADRPGGPRQAVLTYAAWQLRFGGRRDIVGRELQLNNAAFTVTGVMPQGFVFPIDTVEVFLPFWTTTAGVARDSHNYFAVARLAPAATVAAAADEAAAIAARLEQVYPDINRRRGFVVEPLKDYLVEDTRGALALLAIMVGVILATACANVAGLQVGDVAGRRREIGVRAALGASRSRIVRQLVLESVARALVGGAVGVLAAHAAVQFLVANAPDGVYGIQNARMSLAAIAVGIVAAAAAGVLAGLPPALAWIRRTTLANVGMGDRSTADHGSSRLRACLVVGQITLAAVLLIATSLTLRSFLSLTAVDVGFDPANVLTMEYRLPRNKYPTEAAQSAFHTAVLDQVSSVPGVVEAAGVRALPFSGNGSYVAFRLTAAGEDQRASFNVVSESYFRALRIPVLAGRVFDRSDQQAPVAVVSKSLADRAWPGVEPLGRQLHFPSVGIVATVVGVVGDVRHRDLSEIDLATIYGFQDQNPSVFNTLAVRTIGSPLSVAEAVRRAVWSVDPDQPMWKIRPLDGLIEASTATRRFLLQLVSFFGLSAVALALLGLYAVVASQVHQRRREIGVRVALGATGADVHRMVLWQGLRLGLAGTLLGLAAAFVAARALQGYLYGIGEHDPGSFAAATFVLLTAALFSCLLPARRAVRVDPVIALRGE